MLLIKDFCYLFSLIFFSIQISHAAYTIPESINTEFGASYTLEAKQDDLKIYECFVSDGEDLYTIDLNNYGTVINNKNDKDENIMISLGHDICGFKVDHVAVNYTKKWYFTLTDQKNNNYTATARVITQATESGYEIKETKIGDSVTLYCGGNYISNDLNYCAIYNPSNELIKERRTKDGDSEKCTISFWLKPTDLGIWQCVLGFHTNMIPKYINYNVKTQEKDVIDSWRNETEEFLDIGCSVTNPTVIPHYCVMFRPDGERFVLSPGLATKRYTAIGTNFTKIKTTCSMQILKPLEDEEKGTWRCEQQQKLPNDVPIGAFVNVSTNPNQTVAEIPKTIRIKINETLKIKCRVPYSTSYCYMRDPNNVIYPIKNERAPSVGLCQFEKPEKAQLSDNGTWLCGFASSTGTADDTYKFDVHVLDAISIRQVEETVEARSSGSAVLMCTTRDIGDYPLSYCRFLTPNGIMYQIADKGTSDRISYEGRGLAFGDCGIRIHDVTEEDIGTWSCITRVKLPTFRNDEDEVYTNIHLSINDNLGLASILGISFGVLIIVGGLVGIAIKRWRTGRTVLGRGSMNRRRSHDSNNSNEESNVVFQMTSNLTNRERATSTVTL